MWLRKGKQHRNIYRQQYADISKWLQLKEYGKDNLHELIDDVIMGGLYLSVSPWSNCQNTPTL